MPQLQNLVLTDRAATPVNRTFTPRDVVDNVGAVVHSTGVPIGDSRFTVSTKLTGTGKYKSVIRLAVPIVVTETINGVAMPKIARTSYADLTFTFDASSTEDERDDIVGMLMSALDPSKVLVNDAVVKLQGVY